MCCNSFLRFGVVIQILAGSMHAWRAFSMQERAFVSASTYSPICHHSVPMPLQGAGVATSL